MLLQTEAALIGDYGRKQIDYRYVLYMTPLQNTQTIPLSLEVKRPDVIKQKCLLGSCGMLASNMLFYLEVRPDTPPDVSSTSSSQLLIDHEAVE